MEHPMSPVQVLAIGLLFLALALVISIHLQPPHPAAALAAVVLLVVGLGLLVQEDTKHYYPNSPTRGLTGGYSSPIVVPVPKP